MQRVLTCWISNRATVWNVANNAWLNVAQMPFADLELVLVLSQVSCYRKLERMLPLLLLHANGTHNIMTEGEWLISMRLTSASRKPNHTESVWNIVLHAHSIHLQKAYYSHFELSKKPAESAKSIGLLYTTTGSNCKTQTQNMKIWACPKIKILSTPPHRNQALGDSVPKDFCPHRL